MLRNPFLKLLATLFLPLLLVACKPANQETETQPPSQEAQSAQTKHKRPKAGAETVTVPAGTAFTVRLNQEISSGRTSEGATFDGTLGEPLAANGIEVAPAGSSVTGKVTHVVSSGRLNRPAELNLVLTSLTPTGGGPVEISTAVWGEKGKSHKRRDIEMIGGGGGVGALIGALAGGKKGAAIGGLVGAGGGTGVAAATGKQELILPPETRLNFELNAPVTFEVHKR